MSIGRIPSATAITTTPQAPASAAAATGSPSAPYESGRAEATGPVTPPGPLADLRAGHIDRDGFIEAHVAQATSHLGDLPPEEQESVRAAIRERCEANPLLVDLIAKATKTG